MKQILFVGLGLLGGSFAKGLKGKPYIRTAIDPNQDSIDYALAENIIEKGSVTVDETLVAQADMIVFALYPDKMLDWVADYQKFFQKGCIITDLCGVKESLVCGMEEILREDVYYVGAHPMAGKEVSGVRYADGNMFKNANFILTPTEKTAKVAIEGVETLAKDLEFLRISTLSPREHDKAIGFLSQLTHVIAVSLMNCQNNEDYIKYTGDSFRDLTRIAKINEHLWSELFLANQEILLEEIDLFAQELQTFRQFLAEGNVEEMKQRFVTSTQRRKKFE